MANLKACNIVVKGVPKKQRFFVSFDIEDTDSGVLQAAGVVLAVDPLKIGKPNIDETDVQQIIIDELARRSAALQKQDDMKPAKSVKELNAYFQGKDVEVADAKADVKS